MHTKNKTMKTTTTLLALVLLCALSFITTQPLLAAAANTSASLAPPPKQVVDTSGHNLRAGATYYILPAAAPNPRCRFYSGRCRYSDAGFALASIGKSCPLDVVVVPRYHGLPLTFTPYNGAVTIRISTDLNIQFSAATSCGESTVWRLERFDDSVKQWFVGTGGVLGNPGWNTIRNWFKIEKYEQDYRLLYCPIVCKYCNHVCKNVGVFVDNNGNRRVALTDAPYKVKFQKA